MLVLGLRLELMRLMLLSHPNQSIIGTCQWLTNRIVPAPPPLPMISAGLPLTVNGDGLLQDVHRSGFYSIRYGFGVPFQGTLTTILDTDYDDYAVVYSCTNSLLSGVFHSEYIWVLSRSGKISNPTRQNIYEKLDKLGINRSGLTMSDRSTCPTNSSTVGRESDKDLAAQLPVSLPVAPAAGSSANAGGDQSVAGGQSSAPVANLEKSSAAEAIQKSVVVPLLYDLPSAASSSSVGGPKQPSVARAPSAPVDNSKAAPAPVAGASAPSKPQQVAAASPAKPVAASPAGASQAGPSGGQQVAGVQQQQSQQAAPAQQVANASPSASQKSSNQQPQQQSLMAKIQQKP